MRDIIASEEYKFWKVLSRNSRFSENLLALDIRLLENYYKSLGYYDVNISSQSAQWSPCMELNDTQLWFHFVDDNDDLVFAVRNADHESNTIDGDDVQHGAERHWPVRLPPPADQIIPTSEETW